MLASRGDDRRPLDLDASSWPHRDDIFIDDFEAFPGFVAIAERSTGLRRLRIQPLDGSAERYVESDEPDSTAWLADNAEQATTKLRYGFTSLRTPVSTFELDMRTGERVLLKQQPVLGGFDAALYATERLFLAARDGAEVPVSLLYRKGFAAERQGAAADRGLRLLRLFERSLLRLRRPVAGRSRLRLRHRPCPRRAGDGAALVRGRQAPAEEEHLLRLHRRHRGSGRAALRRPRPRLRRGRQRRRAADGRDRDAAPGALPRSHRRRAVRGRDHDDDGRVDPAHQQRVRRVGRPQSEARTTTTCCRTPPTTR